MEWIEPGTSGDEDIDNFVYIDDESEGEKSPSQKEVSVFYEFSRIEKQDKNRTAASKIRTRNSEQWKQNIKKSLRQRGLPYIDGHGIDRPEKSVVSACEATCPHHCFQLISTQKRQEIHKHFWSLSTLKKHVFYENFIERIERKSRTTEHCIENDPKKNYTFIYNFPLDSCIVQVCKKFFLKTLGVSDGTINYFFTNYYGVDASRSASKLSNNDGNKGLSAEKVNAILNHIGSFRTIDSPYCKCFPRHKYLDESLSVMKMYKIYKSEVDDPASFVAYRQIFNARFNYSFGVPNENICIKCCRRATQQSSEVESKIITINNQDYVIDEPEEYLNSDDSDLDVLINSESLAEDDTENLELILPWEDGDDSYGLPPENKKKRRRKGKRNSTEPKQRVRNPEQWKQNVRTRLCQQGLAYVDKNGIERPAKTVGPPCGSTCMRSCSKKISAEQREKIHAYFWNSSPTGKRNFYEKHIKRDAIKRRSKANPKRNNAFRYFLQPDDEPIQVCQTFFLNTLSISKSAVLYFFKNFYQKPPKKPAQGRKGITEKQLQDILNHIESFPGVLSQHCKCSKTRKYLDPTLNITKMHSFYKTEVENPIGVDTYRKMFNMRYNLSFNNPLNDVCNKCHHIEAPPENDSNNGTKINDNNSIENESASTMQDLNAENENSQSSSSSWCTTNNSPEHDEFPSSDGDDSEVDATMNLIKLSSQAETNIFDDDVDDEVDLFWSDESGVKVEPDDTLEFVAEKIHSPLAKRRTRSSEQSKQSVKTKVDKTALPHVDKEDATSSGKAAKPSCGETCRNFCAKKISTEQREIIHTHFWDLSPSERHTYYEKHIKKDDIKRKSSGDPKSNNGFRYYLQPDKRPIQVCQKFFLNTLAISKAAVLYFFTKHYKESPQKLPQNKKGISEKQVQEIINHIASVPAVASKNCKCSKTRKYLASSLNITKMHNLYKKKVKNPIGIDTYRKMFNTRFNLSFNNPQNDVCDKCLHTTIKTDLGDDAAIEKDEIKYHTSPKTRQSLKTESNNFLCEFVGFLGSDHNDDEKKIAKQEEQAEDHADSFESVLICDDEDTALQQEYIEYEEDIESDF